MTIAEFLLARIAEDEAEAGPNPPLIAWTPVYADTKNRLESTHDGLMVAPERVLAECEAKRRIVSLHPLEANGHPKWRYGGCSLCDGDESGVPYGEPYQPCDTLRALALPYADHPDYREEWRPDMPVPPSDA